MQFHKYHKTYTKYILISILINILSSLLLFLASIGKIPTNIYSFIILIIIFIGSGIVPFIMNIVYGVKLHLPTYLIILCAIFTPIGTAFLLSYNKDFIPANKIIKKTISLYKENFKTISPYLLMLFAVTGLLTIIKPLLGSLASTILLYGYSLYTLLYFALIVASIIITMWISINLVRAIVKIYHKEKPPELKTELRQTKHLIIPAFLISFLVGLIVILGTLILIIPGIFLGVLLTFSYYSVIIDEHKVFQSLSTSCNLVKHRWWATFWRLFLPALFFTIILLIIQWIIDVPTEIIFNNLEQGTAFYTFLLILFSLISVLIGVFFTPLTTFPTVILYEELKKTPYVKKLEEIKEETPSEITKL